MRRPTPLLLLSLLVMSSAAAGAPGELQERRLSPELLEGGKILLKNDLQASPDAMRVFREFRREIRRLDRYEETDSEEEAALIALLSGDRDVLGRGKIYNPGLPFPAAYSSSKPMILVIYDAETMALVWFDAVEWETRGNTGEMTSHARLVKRLLTALTEAGG